MVSDKRLLKGRTKRTGRERKRKRQIILICEGGKTNKTEENYFTMLRSKNIYDGILKLDKCGQQTDLANMYRRALQLERTSTFAGGDQIFILFDLDHDSRKWDEKIRFINKSETQNIHFIPSNPSFEIWILYHFEFTTRYFETPDLLRVHLQKYLCDYSKNYKFSSSLLSRLQKAKENSRRSLTAGMPDPGSWNGRTTGTRVFEILDCLENNKEE